MLRYRFFRVCFGFRFFLLLPELRGSELSKVRFVLVSLPLASARIDCFFGREFEFSSFPFGDDPARVLALRACSLRLLRARFSVACLFKCCVALPTLHLRCREDGARRVCSDSMRSDLCLEFLQLGFPAS